jgi:glycosyltransferase involved in cell wall biosynthesis
MKNINPQYFLGYTHKPVIYGNLAAWAAGVKKQFALITGLGYTFQSKILWLNHLLQGLYRLALRNVDKVFFQNPDDETLFQTLGIVKPSNKKSVVVNGSGIDLSEFMVVPLPNKVQFLLIARLLGDKGVREYFKAANLVKKKYPDIRFGLVGWIDDHPNAINEEELEDCINLGDIIFYGRMDDVKPAISESSVYVLPSYREGTPRTVLEAMAMGRPIITTDAPGCKETVENKKNGFIVPTKSVDDLVIAMKNFIEDPELIKTMGNKSRKLAEQKYDVKKVNEKMLREMGLKN